MRSQRLAILAFASVCLILSAQSSVFADQVIWSSHSAIVYPQGVMTYTVPSPTESPVVVYDAPVIVHSADPVQRSIPVYRSHPTVQRPLTWHRRVYRRRGLAGYEYQTQRARARTAAGYNSLFAF
ncbi:hypothetical protein [Crateriforma spongiae]|uniref:hypothetical protein n=1 Tax=Crateriforma spongiae TaxID=2724528 RepID=UPI001445EE23|nr:hypothetical protein [Crateriforma spongiae]